MISPSRSRRLLQVSIQHSDFVQFLAKLRLALLLLNPHRDVMDIPSWGGGRVMKKMRAGSLAELVRLADQGGVVMTKS